MRMRLYHGSVNMIEEPEFGVGNSKNDYGQGFYCTEHIELAKEWACAENRDGFANEYELETDGLIFMNLSDARYHILNWLAILLENRTFVIERGLALTAKDYILSEFLPEYKNADVIRGYRADDSYFSFATAFLNNTITLEQLGKAMKLGKLGEQVVLKSKRSFAQLKYSRAILADNQIYYPKKAARDRFARESFREERTNTVLEGVYVIDIVRNNWKNDDPRLR